MALYYTLPVYKASYQLLHALILCSGSFAREYKYTIGQDLKHEGMTLIKNIYRANKAEDKAEALASARENVEMIRLLLRLMQDVGHLGLKKFVALNQQLEDVSRQLTAWERHSSSKQKAKNVTPELPERSTRAQASVRSESNNPLAYERKDFRPATDVLHESI